MRVMVVVAMLLLARCAPIPQYPGARIIYVYRAGIYSPPVYSPPPLRAVVPVDADPPPFSVPGPTPPAPEPPHANTSECWGYWRLCHFF